MNMRDPNTYLSSKVPYSSLLAPTAPRELSDTIKVPDNTKVSGPISIPIKCLKLVRNDISLIFSEIYLSSFE